MTTKKPKPKAPPKPPPVPEFPVSFETFAKPRVYGENVHVHQREVPMIISGEVSVRRYRVTFEEIAEPVEVIAARLRDLWEAGDNHHHADPIHAAARALGMSDEDLGKWGSKRKVRPCS